MFEANEIWKPTRYPGLLVSSQGRVLAPANHIPMPRGGYKTSVPEPTFGNETRAALNAKHVYYSIYIRQFGRIKVHQVVCEAFHGPKPFDGAVVIHKDENALNNRPENLKWGTQKENLSAPGFREFRRTEMARINKLRAKAPAA
jgi:hypothetical protein